MVLGGLEIFCQLFVEIAEDFSMILGRWGNVGSRFPEVNGKRRIVAVVCVERRTVDRRVMSIVVREFCEGEETGPIIL